MSRLRLWMEDALLWLGIIPLILGMCLLFWICRIFGLDLGDDF